MSVPKLRFQHEDGTSYPEWKDFISLENCCEFISKGATPTTYGFKWEESGIPFFRNDAIKNNTFVYGDYSFISDQANALLNRSEIRSNDILIAITGDIGKVGIVPKDIVKGNINQHLARIRIVQNSIPYFVYQYLCTEKVQTNYQKIKTGLSMPQLSLEQIRKTMIPVVSIEEQQKIVNILYAIDEIIAQSESEVSNLERQKKAAMQKIFSLESRFLDSNGHNYPIWEEMKFADLYEEASEGSTPSTSVKDYYDNGTIPFVKIEDTVNKYINKVNTYITDKGLRSCSAWLIPKNSVIFTNGATIGNVAINTIPVTTKQGILGIIPKTFVTSEFLYYLLSDSNFQHEVYRRQAKGTFATIILKSLNEISVKIPCLEEQNKITGFLSAYDEAVSYAKQELEKWKELKKGLLQQMFV